MNTSRLLFFLIVSVVLLYANLISNDDWPVLTGTYLGQKPPGMTPEYFAPGIVTTRFHEHSAPAISPDGNWIFWSVFLAPLQSSAPQVMLYSKREDGQWLPPQVAQFSGQYTEGGPCFSTDGQKLYFCSCRPLDGKGEPKDWDIWYVNKQAGGWSEPVNLGSPVNTNKDEGQPTVTNDGTIYFISENKDYKYNLCISRARYVNGRYLAQEVLPKPINFKGNYAWCPCIAPDESYLLFSSERKDDLGFGDIYISHRRTDDSWCEPINLGKPISTKHQDRFPGLSPDGKVFFFTSKRRSFEPFYKEPQSLKSLMERYGKPGNGLEDIFWVDAKVIDKFMPKNINKEE